MTRTRSAALLLAVLGVAGLLTGCSTTVSMTPAAGANDPACAAVTVRLGQKVAGQERRWTDAQATGAWGNADDGTTVLLTCGLPEAGPSTLPCDSRGGVDWLIDDSEAPKYRFTTFGRSPAVEVYLDYDKVSGSEALSDLAPAVQQLRATGAACTERPTD